MSATTRRPRPQPLAWFDPRWKDAGSWAFILNRLSGLGLTLYLFLHLAVLSTLARGPEAYDGFIALAKSPVMLLGELLVIAGGLYHGLNGVRIALTSFGIGVRHQRLIFYVLLAITVAGTAAFGWRMFLYEGGA